MKCCPYCGRESGDAAAHCSECGTEFVAIEAKASPPRLRSWIKVFCVYAGVVLLVVFLYLASFGPVTRYCTTVTQSTLGNGTFQQTVMYPRWVGFIYSPAFHLVFGNSSFSELYRRYVSWWEKTK